MKAWHYMGAGLILSLAVHAAASAYMVPDEEAPEIAASAGGAVAVVGSLQDLIEGADETVIEPVETPLETVQPVQPQQPVETVTAAVVPPVAELASVAPVEPLQPVVPLMAAAQASEPLPAEQPAVMAPVQPVAETKPVDAEPPQTPEPAPVVTALPEQKPQTPEPKKPAPKTEPPKKVAKVAKQAGAEFNSQRGGEVVTSPTAQSNANGTADGSGDEQGEGARTNYKGKIIAKLRRAKQAPREGGAGTATVEFTVQRDGSVTGIRVVRSSGSPQLDEAAVAMVRRAAPMPAFPDEIRQASLAFRVPVEFRN
ncbi:energy transducer TonB [Pannonibacter tanglangensis]|uniref:TonB family protein n=1 Tax=Pannonibacter tanglangensis TaxID=2750084 RepID=A0ABW9ZPW8_9HYPH|nr:TonB family protein [Pannonibacter sp. XCT-34]NBN65102.1 TonB family protein [Pannonibacter sp. XCT-34]